MKSTLQHVGRRHRERVFPRFDVGLSAILMADVAGYSRLMGEHEEATVSTLASYRDVFSSYIPKFYGRVVDAKGDALMAEFGTVSDSVACAVDIQRQFAERNEDSPEDRRMRFRIGINLGEVLVRGDEIYGDGVNVAAQLDSLAESDGICISRGAHDQAMSNPLPTSPHFMEGAATVQRTNQRHGADVPQGRRRKRFR